MMLSMFKNKKAHAVGQWIQTPGRAALACLLCLAVPAEPHDTHTHTSA